MSSDEVGKPIWKIKGEGRTTLSAAAIAERAGVSPIAVETAIRELVKAGALEPILCPLCPQCGTIVGEFDTTDEIPDEVTCPYCDQNLHISELDMRLGYRALSSGS